MPSSEREISIYDTEDIGIFDFTESFDLEEDNEASLPCNWPEDDLDVPELGCSGIHGDRANYARPSEEFGFIYPYTQIIYGSKKNSCEEHPIIRLNRMQEGCYPWAMQTRDNLILVAPTGSGKTLVLEMCIIKLLMDIENCEKGLIVYLCPTRALCSERARDWRNKFHILQSCPQAPSSGCTKVEVLTLTGESSNADETKAIKTLNQLVLGNKPGESCLIVTTPEKWDSITRKHNSFLPNAQNNTVRHLFLIDEIHALNDKSRGGSLEALLMRIMMCEISQNSENLHKIIPASHVRIVAVSATCPNVKQIGMWLDASLFMDTNLQVEENHSSCTKVLQFDNSFRPVPLETHVEAFAGKKSKSFSYFQYELGLNTKIPKILSKYGVSGGTSGSCPSCLIFCSTRKSVCTTASALSKMICRIRYSEDFFKPGDINHPFVSDPYVADELSIACSEIGDPQLRRILVHGVAYHHAGLSNCDRSIVESLFLERKIRIICTTSTLATGINLPASIVIIKGTQMYSYGEGYIEYGPLDVIQMIGRAGRPQFDTRAIAVILTTPKMQDKYEKLLVKNAENVESNLLHCFKESVLIEIAGNRIKSRFDAIKWTNMSFLSIRSKDDASNYSIDIQSMIDLCKISKSAGIKLDSALDQITADHHMKLLFKLTLFVVEELIALELVSDGEGGAAGDQQGSLMNEYLVATGVGQLASRSYLDFNTIKTVNETVELYNKSPKEATKYLFLLLCSSNEFESFRLEQGQKALLNELNKNPLIKFKLPNKVKNVQDKVCVLLQAALADISLRKFAGYGNGGQLIASQLENQTKKILQTASRICNYMQTYICKISNNWELVESSIEIQKCIRVGYWDDKNRPIYSIRQLEGIGQVLTQKFVKKGIRSIRELSERDDYQIESIANRHPPFGRKLLNIVQSYPAVTVTIEKNVNTINDNTLQLAAKLFIQNAEKSSTSHYFHFLCINLDKSTLMCHQTLNSEDLARNDTILMELSSENIKSINIKTMIKHESLIGLDKEQSFVIEIPKTEPKVAEGTKRPRITSGSLASSKFFLEKAERSQIGCDKADFSPFSVRSGFSSTVPKEKLAEIHNVSDEIICVSPADSLAPARKIFKFSSESSSKNNVTNDYYFGSQDLNESEDEEFLKQGDLLARRIEQNGIPNLNFRSLKYQK